MFFCLVIFVREKFHARRSKKEIEKLKQHIQTKLEIESESNEKRKNEIDEMRRIDLGNIVIFEDIFLSPRTNLKGTCYDNMGSKRAKK